jgi:PAS domain S-box-containing protein
VGRPAKSQDMLPVCIERPNEHWIRAAAEIRHLLEREGVVLIESKNESPAVHLAFDVGDPAKAPVGPRPEERVIVAITDAPARIGPLLDTGASDAVVWPADRAALLPRLRRASRVGTSAAENTTLRQLLDASPAAVLAKTPEGRIVFANGAYREMYGRKAEDLVGRHYWELLTDPVSRSRVAASDAAALEEEGSTRSELLRVRVGDQARWSMAVRSVVRGASGEPLIVVYLMDVTAEHDAAERDQQKTLLLRQVVEAFPGTVGVKDASGRWLLCNQILAEFAGRTVDEVIGASIDDLNVAPEYAAQSKIDDETALRSNETLVSRAEITDHAGTKRRFVVRRIPLPSPDGARARLLVVATDVTELTAAQDAAEKARQHAVEASQAKSQFLAMMSHEIRTPLNGVLGMLSLAADTALTAEQRDYVEAAQSSGESLRGIINDTLDLAKIEAGRLTLEAVPVYLQPLLEEALGPLAVRARQKGLTFEIHVEAEVPAAVMTDPVRLRQIALNLVGNALKFTQAGSITVRLALAPDDRHMLILRVADTGIGIPPEKRGRIFESFVQADDSTTRVFGGTGLGLSICVELAALFGGSIRLESEVGRGSVFECTLRFADVDPPMVQEPVEGKPAAPAAVARSLRVLLAEDNVVNQKIATALLRKLSCEVVTATDGSLAVEKVKAERFDLVLMDVQMPVMDGLEATRCIRAWEKERGNDPVRIVALTANAMRGDDQICMDAGMDGYLSKPLDRGKLRDLIESAVFRSQSSGGLRAAPAIDASPLDIQACLERYDNDHALLAEVVSSFRATCPAMVSKLRHAVSTSDVVAAERAAAHLRTALLAIGAMRASDLAGALEAGSRAGDLSRGPDLIARIDVEVGRVAEALNGSFPSA